MSDQERRLSASLNRPTEPQNQGIVLPIPTHRINNWRRLFTSIRPYVSNTSGRTLRVYARRFLNENGNTNPQIQRNEPNHNQGIQHIDNPNMLAIWSPSGATIPLQSRTASLDFPIDPPESRSILPLSRSANNLSNQLSQEDSNLMMEDDNVIINMDRVTEPHRRSSTPINNGIEEVLNRDSTSDVEALSEHSTDSEIMNAEETAPDDSDEHANINGETISEILDRHPEVKAILKAVWQYFAFVLIIALKNVYDRLISLITFVVLFTAFMLSNRVVKMYISHQDRRSRRLSVALSATILCIPLIIWIIYQNRDSNLYYSAILIPPENETLSLADLLFIVVLTDFVLKLVTVGVKGLFAFLPNVVVHHKHRGKHYAFIEFSSQLYRSVAPVQPWISYLIDNYSGFKKVFGVFLSALYLICKGPNIVRSVKNFIWGLKKIHHSTYGCTPSKSDIESSGSACPICQDAFVLPTMLPCKHIFCETCVARWFDRERTCPMCRTNVADDPSFRDGSTSFFIQLY